MVFNMKSTKMLNRTRRRFVLPLAFVVAAASLPLLTGCIALPAVSHGVMPSDFPNSVPTYTGRIDEAFAVGSGPKEIWNVSVSIPGAATLATIKSQLVNAGFTVVGGGTAAHLGYGIGATGSKYSAAVVVLHLNKSWVANYTVTSRSAEAQFHLH
jgi:hypothetical protein